MFILNKEDYKRVLPHFERGTKHPEILSVIQGINPGIIYVDNMENSSSALIWNQGMKGYYFIGDNNRDFVHGIYSRLEDEIKDFLIKYDLNCFEFSANTKLWNETIQEYLGDKGLGSFTQHIYRMNTSNHLSHSKRPIDYSIHSIKDTYEDFTLYKNYDYYLRVLVDFWGDIENLMKHGNCYYATYVNEIVGVCYCGFATDTVKTVGIEVDKGYRRKDIGFNLAVSCINEIKSEKKMLWWDCTSTNYGSSALAKKLGFDFYKEYKCYDIKI